MAPTFKYKKEAMKEALNAVKQGMGIRKASRAFGVPKTTLLDKLRGRTPEERKMGRTPYLGNLMEEKLVRWIETQGKKGVPPKRDDVLNSAQMLIKEEQLATPFPNSRPGFTWFKGFLRRHSTLAIRTKRVSRARTRVTERELRDWFTNLKSYLEEIGQMDILKEPSRVFNTDESNLQLCPDTGKVVAFKSWN